MSKKNITILIGVIFLGIIGYYLYRKFYGVKKTNNNGCGCVDIKVNDTVVSDSTTNNVNDQQTTTRIIYEDETFDPGPHLYDSPLYGSDNTVNITYGYQGFDETSPTNMSVPLVARDKEIYFCNPNGNSGVIKDYL